MRLLKLFSISTILFVACKNNNLVVDKDIKVPPYARFVKSDTPTLYLFKDQPNKIMIPFSLTAVSNVDRDVLFVPGSKVSLFGQLYYFPKTFTVAANKLTDSLPLTGDYYSFSDPSNTDTIKISISSDATIPAAGIYNTYNVLLKRNCTLSDTSDFRYLNGSYPVVSESKNLTLIDPVIYTSPVVVSNYTRFDLDSAYFNLSNFLNKSDFTLTVKFKLGNRNLKVVAATYDDLAEGFTYEIRPTTFTNNFDVCLGIAKIPLQLRKYPIGTIPVPAWPSRKEYELKISKH